MIPGKQQLAIVPQAVLMAAVNGVSLRGTVLVLWHLVFGWLRDSVRRRHIYGVTLVLMVACSLASGLSFHRARNSFIGPLCFLRFWFGFGIGGDYPLSATIIRSEQY
jgi:PHS family inorganic phosphate transporter-like MFS transporter